MLLNNNAHKTLFVAELPPRRARRNLEREWTRQHVRPQKQ